jgi:hypothetical protein
VKENPCGTNAGPDNGTDEEKLLPQGAATRAQVAAILQRLAPLFA